MFNKDQVAYKQLRSVIAEKTEEIIFWCGAGLSTKAELPNWKELKKEIIRLLELEARLPADKKKVLDIKNQSNSWVAFKMLKEYCGPVKYRDLVLSQFKGYEKKEIPYVYKKLWQIGADGIITLNLDKLVSRAYGAIYPGVSITDFNGKDINNYVHILKSPHPFIVNLHGTLADASSWVFSVDEFDKLRKKPGYYEFLTSCFITKTNIFLGISADDIAAGGVLASLVGDKKINLGTHYWITDRTDDEARRWAEKSGVLIISYSGEKDHRELDELLNDIADYREPEIIAEPIAKNIDERELGFSDSDDISLFSANEIRYFLNRGATKILKGENENSLKKYEEYLNANDEACYKAWYISTKNGDNIVFDYEIKEKIAKGSFGQVYKAIDKNGNCVAIKILHESIRSESERLMAFRRGVMSMQILEKHKIEGIVPYKDATEIPAMVVMEFIEGIDLKKAIETNQCTSWDDIIRIASGIADIISRAHSLPERVLHRDIRPSNVMLKNYYSCEKYEIVVCDFDLSWHKDAIGQSVPLTATGFLAPEQLISIDDRVTTRSALVDSFGFGMTLYNLVSRIEPIFSEHKHKDWLNKVSAACNRKPYKFWKSIPNRISRLIVIATKDKQNERWDLWQIRNEVKRLLEVIDAGSTNHAELIAEELICRSTNCDAYRYNEKSQKFSINYSNGLSIEVFGNEHTRRIEIELAYYPTGAEEHKTMRKYFLPKAEKLNTKIKKAGWLEDHDNNIGIESFSMKYSKCVIESLKNLEIDSKMLGEIESLLHF